MFLGGDSSIMDERMQEMALVGEIGESEKIAEVD